MERGNSQGKRPKMGMNLTSRKKRKKATGPGPGGVRGAAAGDEARVVTTARSFVKCLEAALYPLCNGNHWWM